MALNQFLNIAAKNKQQMISAIILVAKLKQKCLLFMAGMVYKKRTDQPVFQFNCLYTPPPPSL